MIETMEYFWPKIESSKIIEKLNLQPKQYVLATIHRQENTDRQEDLKNILEILQSINQYRRIVFPVHPGTRRLIKEFGLENLIKNLAVIDPLGYIDFIKLVAESGGVVTDSGGIQEETTHLGIPCATLRDSTERPITVSNGSNKLFKTTIAVVPEIKHHLNRSDFRSRHIPLWDKGVSQRIFESLEIWRS